MPIGMPRCRILGLLCHGRDAIKTDVGKEDDRRGLEDAAPAELAEDAGVRRDIGHPVGWVDVERPNTMTAMTMLTLIATMMVLTKADSLMPL